MFSWTLQYKPFISAKTCVIIMFQSSIAGQSPNVVLGSTAAYSSGVGSSPNGANDARRAHTRNVSGSVLLMSISSFLLVLLADLCRQLVKTLVIQQHMINAPQKQSANNKSANFFAAFFHYPQVSLAIPGDTSGPYFHPVGNVCGI